MRGTRLLKCFESRLGGWSHRSISNLCAFALVVLIWFGARCSLQPTPRLDADAEGFSAARALETARMVLGEEPRPVGSPANIAAVARLKEYFSSIGYAPQEQVATVKVPGRGETTLRNVFIQLEGRSNLPAILLVSHHDSVAVSPGGGDNGMGVAVCLEAARMMALQQAPLRPVVILVTDGEEAGLLGARLFAQNHTLANDIGAVINIDNRGGSGPAQLFETGPHDYALINAIAPRVTHPIMGSFFAEIYRRMPNGTDLSAFLERGKTGINIACTGSIERYHTPLDTFNAVNLDSLQHEGEMAIQALEGLSGMPADAMPSKRAVCIDVFGACVLVWTAESGVILSIASLIAIAGFGTHRARVQSQFDPHGGAGFLRDYLRGAIAAVVALGATVSLVMGAAWLMELCGLYGRHYALEILNPGKATDARPNGAELFSAAYWPAHGIALQILLGLLFAPTAWITARLFLRHGSPWVMWSGMWSVLAVLNLSISLIAPGAGAILLPTVLVAACMAWLGAAIFGVQSLAMSILAVVLPIAVAAALYCPLEILGWTGVGLSMPLFRAFLSGFYAVFFLSLLSAPNSPTFTSRR